MELCLLLLVPVVIGLGGLIFGRGKVTWKEFAIQEVIVVVLVGAGFFIGRCSQTRDVEVWSGSVVNKQRVRVHCRHSYPCNPITTCSGNPPACTTVWQICYAHTFDYDWNVYASTDEVFTLATVDSQGLQEPLRYTHAYIGEPTASTHSYKNYIKGSPWTIIKRTGAMEKFKTVPQYPDDVYNYYYVNRFVSSVAVPDAANWNQQLAEINAELGAKKKVNVIVVIAKTDDSAYVHALEEGWLGGKKNDFVVVLGVLAYPRIVWVRTMSWTRAEDLKIAVRDRVQEIGTLADRDKILGVVAEEVKAKFVHRSMDDFKYLNAEIRPPTWVLFLIFAIGLAVAIGLTIYFWRNDPFGDEPARWQWPPPR